MRRWWASRVRPGESNQPVGSRKVTWSAAPLSRSRRRLVLSVEVTARTVSPRCDALDDEGEGGGEELLGRVEQQGLVDQRHDASP